MPGWHRFTDIGFHDGELEVQQRAGVRKEVARLAGMLAPAELTGGIAGFIAVCTFAVLTARDSVGRLWISPLTGEPGFLTVDSPNEISVHVSIGIGDPLHELPSGQRVGMIAMDFATRRRVRINGMLTQVAAGRLTIVPEQAYGNCPKYIQQRLLTSRRPDPATAGDVRRGETLAPEDIDLIGQADTFFLGTVNPERGADASHRGGPPGFVRIDDAGQLWWPDYSGNNMFNSFGNLAVDPEAALVFVDFPTGRVFHLSGTAEVEWGHAGRPGDDGRTGRTVRFALQKLVTGSQATIQGVAHRAYPRNPPLSN